MSMVRKIIYRIIFAFAAVVFIAAVIIGIIGLVNISDTLIHWALVMFIVSLGINMFNVLYIKPVGNKNQKNDTDDKQ